MTEIDKHDEENINDPFALEPHELGATVDVAEETQAKKQRGFWVALGETSLALAYLGWVYFSGLVILQILSDIVGGTGWKPAALIVTAPTAVVALMHLLRNKNLSPRSRAVWCVSLIASAVLPIPFVTAAYLFLKVGVLDRLAAKLSLASLVCNVLLAVSPIATELQYSGPMPLRYLIVALQFGPLISFFLGTAAVVRTMWGAALKDDDVQAITRDSTAEENETTAGEIRQR